MFTHNECLIEDFTIYVDFASVLPLAPKLSPDTPTICGMLVLSNSFRFNFCYIFQDITLFMAPVSNSVLIFMSKLLFANT